MRIKTTCFILLLVSFGFYGCAQQNLPDTAALQTPVKNYQLSSGTLATSGSLSRESLQELHNQGVQRVIDLRTAGEGIDQERRWSDAIGVEYYNFPVTRGQLPDADFIAEIGKLLDETAAAPTLLHCGSGHRAGIVLAMHLVRGGTAVDDALQQAKQAGTRENSLPELRQHLLSIAEDT